MIVVNDFIVADIDVHADGVLDELANSKFVSLACFETIDGVEYCLSIRPSLFRKRVYLYVNEIKFATLKFDTYFAKKLFMYWYRYNKRRFWEIIRGWWYKCVRK